MLRDADDLIAPAVVKTIDALDLQPEDAAAVKLARFYAVQIDQATGHEDPKIGAWAARNIGPLLLDALRELGATPAARAAIKRGTKNSPNAKPNGLAKLREARGA